MAKISSICSRICSGGTPKSTENSYYGGTIPWLNTKEIDFNVIESTEKTITEAGLNNSSAKWVEAPSVIVAMYGATAGKVAISNIRLTTNQACCNLNIDPERADYRFVYYALKNDFTRLSSMANGGAQQNLNAQQIKDFDIPDFSLSEQKRIAAILSSLDEKIETNRKINARLEELAQALFKSWFIDFEPFGGKMPEEWILKPIDEVYHIRYGKGLSKSQFINNGYPVYGANGIIGYINQPNVNQKVVLITSRGSGSGDVSYTYDDEAFITNNSFIVEPNPDYAYMGLPYIYQSFKKLDFKGLCSGSAQPQLTNLAISSLSIIVPNKDVVDKFTRITSTLYGLIFSIIKKSSRLAALRDTLLPKLMSGELIPE